MTEAVSQTSPQERRVSLLGATGSVGQTAIALLKEARAKHPDAYPVAALTAGRNVARLAEDARELRADMAVIADPAHYEALKSALAGTDITAAAGAEGLIEAADAPADWMLAAIVGAAGIAPTLRAASHNRILALANKESVVCAGPLLMKTLRASGGRLVPVDSEHHALFELLARDGLPLRTPLEDEIASLVLPASGGPFRTASLEEMRVATQAQALAHPVWRMGRKISIDSATLMNKALELIEAYYFFDIAPERLEIVIHPEARIHAMLVHRSGAISAYMGPADMRLPVAGALAWPERAAPVVARLQPSELGALSFAPVDAKKFPAPDLARRALQSGGAAPTILNAANEEAVHAFLDGKIGFLDILRLVDTTLRRMSDAHDEVLDDMTTILDMDQNARRITREILCADFGTA